MCAKKCMLDVGDKSTFGLFLKYSIIYNIYFEKLPYNLLIICYLTTVP